MSIIFSSSVTKDDLQDVIDLASGLIHEAKFRFEEDGLRIRAADQANVGMIDLLLEEEGWGSYGSTSVVVGLSLDKLDDAISMADSDSTIAITYDDETRYLNIEYDGLDYQMAGIDPDSIRQEPDIPDLGLPAKFTIARSQFSRAITAADMVSDHIEFAVDADAEVFEAAAEGDTDDVDLGVETGDDLSFEEIGAAESLYSLDYLKDIEHSIPNDVDELTLDLGEDFPVKIRGSFADSYGQFTYMLAPRIQSE